VIDPRIKFIEKDPHTINRKDKNDHRILQYYLNLIDLDNKIYIDIGCSTNPQTPLPYIFDADHCIFFECDPEKIQIWRTGGPRLPDGKRAFQKLLQLPNFALITKKVTPYNIGEIIENIIGRKDPKFVDIDIDGYDYYVLRSILESHKPSLIMAEINEKIPPPIKFTVNYDSNWCYDGSHFYGMSLSKFCELAEEYSYDVINLSFNNVFAVHKNKNPGLQTFKDAELYEAFYRSLRLNPTGVHNASIFNHNENMDHLLLMPPGDALDELNRIFEPKYRDKYSAYI